MKPITYLRLMHKLRMRGIASPIPLYRYSVYFNEEQKRLCLLCVSPVFTLFGANVPHG
jgi:hypothetical protein